MFRKGLLSTALCTGACVVVCVGMDPGADVNPCGWVRAAAGASVPGRLFLLPLLQRCTQCITSLLRIFFLSYSPRTGPRP